MFLLSTAAFILLALFAKVDSSKTIELDGEPKYAFVASHYRALSKEQCFESFCEDEKTKDSCVVTYIANRTDCFYYLFESSKALLFLWNSKAYLKQTGAVTLMRISGPTLPIPKVLWLFNQRFKGQNLGSVGGALNMTVRGLQWTADSPCKSKFDALLSSEESPIVNAENFDAFRDKFAVNKPPFYISNYNYVNLVQNGKRLLRFTSGFTAALWLKTDEDRKMIIFDEDVNYKFTKGLDFWLLPKASSIAISGDGSDEANIFTTKNDTNLYEWRHVAVTQIGRNKPKFYLNGEVWPISKDNKIESMEIRDPEKISMWTTAYERNPYNFAGAMACFTIFDEPLSISQIRKLRSRCP